MMNCHKTKVCKINFYYLNNLSKFCTIFSISDALQIKYVACATVICDKIIGITVFSDLGDFVTD